MAGKKFNSNIISDLDKNTTPIPTEIHEDEPIQATKKPVKKATTTKPKTSAKAEKPKAVAAEQPQAIVEKPKKPVGRPKTRGDYKLVNVAIPVATYDRMKTASALLGNNMTAYILGLVYDDLNANKGLYDEIEQVLLKPKK